MDTFKKEIYLEARRLIASGEDNYLCIALHVALCNVTGVEYMWLRDTEMENLFREFSAMNDGVFWHPEEGGTKGHVKSTIGTAWWTQGWKEPRLAMIDYLLSR